MRTKVAMEDNDGIKVIESRTLFVHTVVSLFLIFGAGAMAFAYLQKDVESQRKENERQNIVLNKVVDKINEQHTHIALYGQTFSSMKNDIADIRDLLIEMIKKEKKE